ncbi:MAG TPA: hypothetical protein EYH57_06960 [Sulfurovum sp.]|nr:hypothetical protein [Sulfurovum sp.]
MNMLFSLLYAPLVFLSLRYFDIRHAAAAIFIIAALWFLFSLKNIKITILFPLFYMSIALFAYMSEAFLVLKIMPLLISLFFSLLLLVSYLQERSLILYFANRFSKHTIEEKEQAYIQKSTLFWFLITLVNIAIHTLAYLSDTMYFWLYYSSIGWYILFILAGILQFMHRKYCFLKDDNV